MAKNKGPTLFPPLIFNVFKPAGISSFDVVRYFKKNLPHGHGKIGHFGTLDPFACGVLLIGIAGASRLNDLVHEKLAKTYLAVGKLGVHTETGDLTSAITRQDQSEYFEKNISQFENSFIQSQLQEKFLGEYWQSPHQFSAAKFQGKKLHQWAREGVEIKKEKKRRYIYSLDLVKFDFPYLSIRFTVSSGTYIRSLFQECAEFLGTHGALIALVRERIGGARFEQSLKKKYWPSGELTYPFNYGLTPDRILTFPSIVLEDDHAKLFCNGVHFVEDRYQDYQWVRDEENLLGLMKDGAPVVVFPKRS